MMRGPNNSGRIAASNMTAHPAWQLPTTPGCRRIGMKAITLSRKGASARAMSAIVCPGMGFGQKSDERTGQRGLECNDDPAVRLETADPRDWCPQARGSHHCEGVLLAESMVTQLPRRDDPQQPVIDRSLQRSPIEDKLRLVTEHDHASRCLCGLMVTVPETTRRLGVHSPRRRAEQAQRGVIGSLGRVVGHSL